MSLLQRIGRPLVRQPHSVHYLKKSVSVTDMKIEIEISDVLQFRLVVHMSRFHRPARRRLLDQHHVLENEERSMCWAGSSQCREFP
jgi:hypothetical protein